MYRTGRTEAGVTSDTPDDLARQPEGGLTCPYTMDHQA